MPQEIELPNGQIIEFPDGMSIDDINRHTQDYVARNPSAGGHRPPQLAEGTPLINPGERGIRNLMGDISRQNWSQYTVPQAIGARALDALNAVPIVGPMLVDENNQNVQDVRFNAPVSSGLTRFGVNAAAYGGLGAGLPGLLARGAGVPANISRFGNTNQLFRTLPRAMGSSGVIEGTDAAISGNRDPLTAATMGAVSPLLLGAPAKVITPRSNAPAARAREARVGGREAEIDRLAQAHRDQQMGILGQLDPEAVLNPQLAEGLADLRHRLYEGARQQAMQEVPHAPIQIPHGWAANAASAGTGLGIGHLASGGDPMMATAGLLLGASAPTLVSQGAEAVQRGANRLLASPRGQRITQPLQRYSENQILPDRMRAILHALSTPATTESVDYLGLGAQ